MKLKLKPLMLGTAVAVSAALSGCGSEQSQPEITDVFKEVGLWCKSPELVQIASADFYPLSSDEQTALDNGKAAAKIAAETKAGDSWDEAEWEASFKYEDLDLYSISILGLTIEEKERQAVAKEEARAFQISQGQDVIRGDDFDAWFDVWFEKIPPANYLGPSARISRSVNATTPEMDGTEICYTPPLSCPNYLMVDETGTNDCIVPTQNPIVDAPPAVRVAGAGEAVAYYRHEDHVEGQDNSALYENIVVHAWNNDDCTAYAAESISPQWGLSPAGIESDIDDNYGMYWVFNLVDEPSNCGNIIFNDTSSGKKISDSDLVMPLGTGSDVILHNIDKVSYAHDDFPVNVLDGLFITNQHPFFGAEASSGLKSCGWSMEADESGEQCVGQELICPEGSVAVGVDAVDIASQCVAEFDPETTDLLLRGGFNGWDGFEDPNSTFTYAGGGQYRVNYTYASDCVVVEAVEASEGVEAVEGEDCVDSYDFKVADADWDNEPAVFGSIKGGDQSAVGSTILMTVGSGVGQNMKVDFGANKIYQFMVNAADVTAVELTIVDVKYDLLPTIRIGDETYALSAKGGTEYGLTKELAAETEYTISLDGLGSSFGAPADNILEGDKSVDLVADGTAFSFITTIAGEHIFTFNLSDLEKPVLKVETPKPFLDTDVFLRGSLNGWGDSELDKVIWDVDNRTYTTIYGLEEGGTYTFKFASSDWSTIDVGAQQVDFAVDTEALIANSGEPKNIDVTISESNIYQFTLDYSAATPVLSVTPAPVYLRGGVWDGGWAARDTERLGFTPVDAENANESAHVYSSVINVPTSGDFKIADAGWGGTFGINYGAAEDNTVIELGVAYPLKSEGGNIKIDVPAGDYNFSFDRVNETLMVTPVE